MTSTTAITEAQQLLAATPTRELMTKAYQLTHQMDAADERMRDYRGSDRAELAKRQAVVTDLRAMRDLITAEVLTRTGDA